MQSFQLMNNPLIQRTCPKNTLKTSKRVFTRDAHSPTNYYGQKYVFEIPQNHNNLSQAFIKCTVNSAAAINSDLQQGIFMFKSISLKTRRGLTLMTQSDIYASARVDEYDGTQIGSYIEPLIQLSPALDGATNLSAVVWVPLFMFFSEHSEAFLQTRQLEPLQFECLMNSTKEAMHMDADPDSISVEMYLFFQDDKVQQDMSLPKQLKCTYDVYDEIVYRIPDTGVTKHRMLIQCPFPSYLMRISMIASDLDILTYNNITGLKLTTQGTDIVDMDTKLNFCLGLPENALVGNSAINYWFGTNRNRCEMHDGLVSFTGTMAPTWLELTFDATTENYDIYVQFEHVTVVRCSSDGELDMDMQAVFEYSALG